MATIDSLVEDAPPEGAVLLGKVQYWFACLFAAGWAAVVCAGLYRQLADWEHPCPLCLVQRMCMLLAALGAAYVIRTALWNGTVSGRDYMTGWGLSLVAATAGTFAAWREGAGQVLPGAGVKGGGGAGEVFGLQPYLWAGILFQLSVLAVGVALAFAYGTADRSVPADWPGPLRAVGVGALWFLGLVIAVSLVAAFLEEGFHWFLPDAPARYRFFDDVGALN
ncbi:disulfide bond formation protein B [Streptomyces sp. NPDC047014]|uniref:disulfide bond formation protein B n=1 Tax=Streptomyces sp. NPDC047014 TaxID=3155736 RepID=UPI0033EC7E7A